MVMSGRGVQQVVLVTLLAAVAVGAWTTPQVYLNAADAPPQGGDGFGAQAVALNGDWLAVQRESFDTYAAAHSVDQHAVLMFRRDAGSWNYTQTLTRPASGSDTGFGDRLAILHDQETPANSFLVVCDAQSFKVYVYRLDPHTAAWYLSHERDVENPQSRSNWSVPDILPLVSQTIYLGNENDNDGSVSVLEYNSAQDTWERTHYILAPANSNRFGSAVDVSADGSRIVVGDIGYDNFGGRVYVLDLVGGQYEHASNWTSPITTELTRYCGASVQISEDGTMIAYACPSANDTPVINVGRIHIVHRDIAARWVHNATIEPSDAVAYASVGANGLMRMDNGIIAAGIEEYSSSTGALFVWERNSTGHWEQTIVQSASPVAGQRMGTSIDFDAGRIVCGGNGFSKGAEVPGLVMITTANGCGRGQTYNSVTDTCTACRYGDSVLGAECSCPRGQYKDDLGQEDDDDLIECYPCPDVATSELGAFSSDACVCPASTQLFTNEDDSLTCELSCPPGQYVSGVEDDGIGQCVECADGLTTEGGARLREANCVDDGTGVDPLVVVAIAAPASAILVGAAVFAGMRRRRLGASGKA